MARPIDDARRDLRDLLGPGELAAVDALLKARFEELKEKMVDASDSELVCDQARAQEVRDLRRLLKPPHSRGSGQGATPSADTGE